MLASAVLSSRTQRVGEYFAEDPRRAATANCHQRDRGICILGLISAVTGALLAILAGWALSFYFFKTAAALSVGAVVSVPDMRFTVITVLAGALGCWGIFRRSALETFERKRDSQPRMTTY